MKFESFLDNVYFGDLDAERMNYSEASEEDAPVRRLTDAFEEASKNHPPETLEKLGRVPDELLDKLRKSGFFGLIIPEEYGGQGLSISQYLTVVEKIVQLDMALGILALAHQSIGMKGIILYGNEEQKKHYLPLAASGEMIFSYALTEPLIGSDAQNIKTTAALDESGNYYILNGTKTYITNANYTGGFTVFAQLDPEKPGTLGAFIVERNYEGVSVGADMGKMGLTASSTASVKFTDVRVPKENLLGKPGDGFKIAMMILSYGRLALGAASTGLLSVSYSEMMKRADSRVQFGGKIKQFELVQEKIVKAFVHGEVVKAITMMTAGFLEKKPLGYVVGESSHTKFYGTNLAWESLYDALQVFGGAGYLKTHPYGKRMRDFRVTTIFEGTTEVHSIYPPLALARIFSKNLSGKSAPGKLVFLLSARLKRGKWNFSSSIPEARRALKDAKRYSRIFRRLFIRGLIHYGKNLPFKEFYLRRLTMISVAVYGLLSLSAKAEFLQKNGERDSKELTNVLAALKYYIAEAETIVEKSNRKKSSRLELEHAALFKKIDN
ncbi:MAG: acyl-CoA dehydrogenase family protein [Spirochaetes bacterium]|nr:acyl-CoA dehydrogenase family protein [Spirochaetota bacterium]